VDPRFNDIFNSPENDIFKVVFFPDRIYHARYLNATRSRRYRYNVQEVRGKLDLTVMKGEVYMDGLFLSTFIRIEYRAGRLVEVARERGRFVRGELLGWLRLHSDGQPSPEAMVKLHYDRWIDAYQVEIWQTLEAPAGRRHDFQVLDMMGRTGQITRVAAFEEALAGPKAIKQVELAFSENDRDLPFGYPIAASEREWDNNFLSSHQEPQFSEPSHDGNTIHDENYLVTFQRGWFIEQARSQAPVRYLNGMMDSTNPDVRAGNIIEMRWLLQREFGGSNVFFHEVTIPPGTVEGTHQHIGSEELYYITEGKGIAYMREGDDPKADANFPTVTREIYGIGPRACKELPVQPGSIIFTKSGGMHGIRNDGPDPLRFVAFLYHTA
jgi:oxalate decarboxylase/phosphoglucose isomerase-like protein (cupin superfamily)